MCMYVCLFVVGISETTSPIKKMNSYTTTCYGYIINTKVCERIK